MGLTENIPGIDRFKDSVYVMHERSEKYFPPHTHKKGQLSYIEGG